jgi:hypothetical protein
LLRKHAATLAKARHPALISFQSCEIFRKYAKESGQTYGPTPRSHLHQGEYFAKKQEFSQSL